MFPKKKNQVVLLRQQEGGFSFQPGNRNFFVAFYLLLLKLAERRVDQKDVKIKIKNSSFL